MKLWDAIVTARILQQQIEAQGNQMETGEELRVDIPFAESQNALLVRGKAGKRFRIQAVVVEREK